MMLLFTPLLSVCITHFCTLLHHLPFKESATTGKRFKESNTSEEKDTGGSGEYHIEDRECL